MATEDKDSSQETMCELLRRACVLDERFLAAANDTGEPGSGCSVGPDDQIHWKEIQYRCAREAISISLAGVLSVSPTALEHMSVLDVTIGERPAGRSCGEVRVTIGGRAGQPDSVFVVPHSTVGGFCVGVWVERQAHLLDWLQSAGQNHRGEEDSDQSLDETDEKELAALAMDMFST